MSNASLPPNAPMANGTMPDGHGEADASPLTAAPAADPAAALTPSLKDVCATLHAQVQAFLSAEPQDDVTKSTQAQTRISMAVIDKALQEYSFDAMSLSYNGGKDCLVLLVLYLAVLHTHFERQRPAAAFPTSIPSIYAKPPDPFPAVSSFVAYSSRIYHLDLAHISTIPIPSKKGRDHSDPIPPPADNAAVAATATAARPIVTFRDAFALYLSQHPRVRAIFVGTRRTDPHGGHLTHFDRTDHHWPDFMRVHPVIDWRLSEIWTFLRSEHLRDVGGDGHGPLAYCSMYDQGYTSLGGVNDTVRNPRLRVEGAGGDVQYKPAYEMTLDREERSGRE